MLPFPGSDEMFSLRNRYRVRFKSHMSFGADVKTESTHIRVNCLGGLNVLCELVSKSSVQR